MRVQQLAPPEKRNTGQSRPSSGRKRETLPTLSISDPIFAGLSVTMTPAFWRAATLSEAAPGGQYQLGEAGES
jgi:hypothetical protein